jgi:hypothetical protein
MLFSHRTACAMVSRSFSIMKPFHLSIVTSFLFEPHVLLSSQLFLWASAAMTAVKLAPFPPPPRC